MGNIISLSITNEDKAFLKANPQISPSKLFRSALKIDRRRGEFIEMYSIDAYPDKILKFQERVAFFGKEILIREERIESLQNVLAQKELSERRI